MSASRSSRSSKSSRVACSPKKMKKPSPAVAAARAPWIVDGIDYGPARAAVRDLANWALDIADREVEDWPVGKRHVRNARRFVSARIDGKQKPRHVSTDDIWFTTDLLVRIFDEDLELGLSEVLTILETLSLPVDTVPMRRQAAPRPTLAALAPMLASITPLLVPTLHTLTKAATQDVPAPIAPLRFCDGCGYVHEAGDHVRHRNAA